MDKIRVIKLLVYEGPRDVLEEHLKNTVVGHKHLTFNKRAADGTTIHGEYDIIGINIGQFPEILEQNNEPTS